MKHYIVHLCCLNDCICYFTGFFLWLISATLAFQLRYFTYVLYAHALNGDIFLMRPLRFPLHRKDIVKLD